MNGLRTVIYFGLFFLGFFMAEVIRFQRFIFDGDHSFSILFILILIAALSGLSLVIALAGLDLFPRSVGKKVVLGGSLGVVLFFLLFGIEDGLSNQRLYSDPQARSFSEVKGHCGVYVGRALIQIYRWDWNPSLEGILADFNVSNRCRIDRFRELVKRGKASCKADEDRVQCLVRWMSVFAERGFWNADVRRMFLSEVIQAKSPPEIMMEYAMKDHELDAARPSVLKQAGLEEQFSDDFIYFKQMDELQNVLLTKEIFDSVASTLQTETATPNEGSLLSKFKDTVKDVSFKTEKIPELEKELAELKKRVQL